MPVKAGKVRRHPIHDARAESREVALASLNKRTAGGQTPAMFCVQWVFEPFLKMNESAGAWISP